MGDLDSSRLARFSRVLQGSTVHADNTARAALPEVPVGGLVGTAMQEAASALRAANDLLAVHIGNRSRPRTPEGFALATRYQERDNLANTASLALYASSLDDLLGRAQWLKPTPDAGKWHPLLVTVNRDVRDSRRSGRFDVTHQLATAGVKRRGFSRLLAPLPTIDDAFAWRSVGTAVQAVQAMDAARMWLFHYSDQMTARQLATAIRAGLDITVTVSQILNLTGAGSTEAGKESRPASKFWTDAARAAGVLRSPDGTQVPDVGLASTALVAVSKWLTPNLRTVAGLARSSDTEEPDRRQTAWRQTAGQVAARLSDIAESLRQTVEKAQRDDKLLHPSTTSLEPGRSIQVPRWRRLQRGDPVFLTLTSALQEVQRPLQSLTEMAGVPLLPEPRDVAQALAERNAQLQARKAQGAARSGGDATRPPSTTISPATTPGDGTTPPPTSWPPTVMPTMTTVEVLPTSRTPRSAAVALGTTEARNGGAAHVDQDRTAHRPPPSGRVLPGALARQSAKRYLTERLGMGPTDLDRRNGVDPRRRWPHRMHRSVAQCGQAHRRDGPGRGQGPRTAGGSTATAYSTVMVATVTAIMSRCPDRVSGTALTPRPVGSKASRGHDGNPKSYSVHGAPEEVE